MAMSAAIAASIAAAVAGGPFALPRDLSDWMDTDLAEPCGDGDDYTLAVPVHDVDGQLAMVDVFGTPIAIAKRRRTGTGRIRGDDAVLRDLTLQLDLPLTSLDTFEDHTPAEPEDDDRLLVEVEELTEGRKTGRKRARSEGGASVSSSSSTPTAPRRLHRKRHASYPKRAWTAKDFLRYWQCDEASSAVHGGAAAQEAVEDKLRFNRERSEWSAPGYGRDGFLAGTTVTPCSRVMVVGLSGLRGGAIIRAHEDRAAVAAERRAAKAAHRTSWQALAPEERLANLAKLKKGVCACGHRLSLCPTCKAGGGSGLCAHGRRKGLCTVEVDQDADHPLGYCGSGVCAHGRRKRLCKLGCGGSGVRAR